MTIRHRHAPRDYPHAERDHKPIRTGTPYIRLRADRSMRAGRAALAIGQLSRLRVAGRAPWLRWSSARARRYLAPWRDGGTLRQALWHRPAPR